MTKKGITIIRRMLGVDRCAEEERTRRIELGIPDVNARAAARFAACMFPELREISDEQKRELVDQLTDAQRGELGRVSSRVSGAVRRFRAGPPLEWFTEADQDD